MPLVRFLLWSTLATIVIVSGVIVGTGVAGAVMGPAVASRVAEPAATSCPIEVSHEVGFDAGGGTYALQAVEVSAPACAPGTRVSVAIDGRTIGQATLDAQGAARLELADPLPAAAVEHLQVSSVS